MMWCEDCCEELEDDSNFCDICGKPAVVNIILI